MENFPYYYKIVRDKISAYLQGEKKLYVFLASIFFVVIFIGFISPTLVQHKKETWNDELQSKLASIQKTSLTHFEKRQTSLINTAKKISDFVTEDKNLSLVSLKSLLQEEKFLDFQIFLLDSAQTEIFTNVQSGITGEDIGNSSLKAKATFFKSTPLQTFLCYRDEIIICGRKYYLLTSTIFESDFLGRNFSPENNFSTELENTFECGTEVLYSPSKAKSLDGRYFSFEIPNNQGQKIGLITVAKPTLKAELKTFKENSGKAQSLFIVTGIILLGLIVRYETKQLKVPIIRPFLAIIYLVFLRWMLFVLRFPNDFLPDALTNPNYFSSAFGGGIVKSPLEFLITALFFCTIVFYIYHVSKKRIDVILEKKAKNLVVRLAAALFSLLILLLSIRGIAAAVKSVVFDSSLRYFDTVDIIPGVPHLVMHIAIFLIILSAILLSQILIKIFYHSLPNKFSERQKIIVTISLFLLASLIFVSVQKQPLVSKLLFEFASILTLVVYVVTTFTNTKTFKFLLIISFSSSILTISLMNFFNTELEKEELKRTALSLSRPQESYLNFLLNESLSKIAEQPKLKDFYLATSTNYSALALDLWLNSSLRDEKVLSSITLLDKQKKILGYFSTGVQKEQLLPQIAQAALTRNLQIFDISDKAKQWQKILHGIAPIIERNQLIGYVASTVIFTPKNSLNINSISALFQKPELNFRSLKERNFNVFLLGEDKIYPIGGNILPTITDAGRLFKYLSKEKEGWINYKGASNNLLGFGILRASAGNHPFLVVAQKEEDFSFSLFNFFKLFIVHSTFLLLILLLLFVAKTKGRFRLTFRSQLLFAFLLIAILPIIALALYNKNSVEEKNISMIQNALKEKANLAQNYFEIQLINTNPKEVTEIFNETNRNLLLSFSVFENSKLIYSSQQNIYDAVLVGQNVTSLLLEKNDHLGNGFFNQQYIGSHKVLSFYQPITIGPRTFILEVNDYFNQIPLALNFIEVNVFLFGVYSLAIVLIIIISSFLADQISSPIRRLTRATRAVAHGDLNVMLNDKSMGEMKELISGFNIMTEELRKNQLELAELEREQAWKDMARQVAHEIKNPLTPMKLTLQQLVAMYRSKSKNFDSLFEKVSETILAQIETLSQIASEFSSFAKMPSPNVSQIDLKKALNEIILLFNDENVSINLTFNAHTVFFTGDASQFKRMLINLIRNSIQANADEVNFSVEEDEKNLLISISDNGSGIPEKFLYKIFNLNFTTKSSGMGIGLKLAKKFVEGIDGEITVKETSSNGTTFLIRIPKET